jgi:hypothetical protein
MGTNFFIQRKSKNGRTFDLHIAKCSYGWKPHFRGYTSKIPSSLIDISEANKNNLPELTSWQQWKMFLLEEIGKGGLIFDEYDEAYDLLVFFERIESQQEDQPRCPAASNSHYTGKTWIDDEGYSFDSEEFS